MSYLNEQDTKFWWYFEFITKSLWNLTEYLQAMLRSYKVRDRKITLGYDMKCESIYKGIIKRKNYWKSISSFEALRPLLSGGLLNVYMKCFQKE